MPCGSGLLAEDCSAEHWAPKVDGRRESGGQWRAPCPVCQSKRGLQFDVPGKAVRWRLWCACEKDDVRPVLLERIGQCAGGVRKSGLAIKHDDLAALALSGMPAMSLRLALLELSGMSTPDALDKLGVRREHRSRVITGRTNFGASPQVRHSR